MKNRKTLLIGLVAAFLIPIFWGCHNSKKEEIIDGGTTNKTNADAPKEIQSKQIESFYASIYSCDVNDDSLGSTYTFQIKEDDQGKLILTAKCNFYDHSIEISSSDLEDLQKIIDDNQLVQNNGIDEVTAGLGPEYGPYLLKVIYQSGEQLYFQTNGDMDDCWVVQMKQYIEQLLIDAGYEEMKKKN